MHNPDFTTHCEGSRHDSAPLRFGHPNRLDPALIDRSYAGQTRLMDKLRILIGKPSVPETRVSRAPGDAS